MRRLFEAQKKAEKAKSKKQLLMIELNVVQNVMERKRFQTYNLVGHTKMITALDANHGIIVSGSKDNLVKIWDTKTKKAFTFSKHMNVVTQAIAWDSQSALTASADRSIRYWDIKQPDECVHLKGHGAAVT